MFLTCASIPNVKRRREMPRLSFHYTTTLAYFVRWVFEMDRDMQNVGTYRRRWVLHCVIGPILANCGPNTNRRRHRSLCDRERHGRKRGRRQEASLCGCLRCFRSCGDRYLDCCSLSTLHHDTIRLPGPGFHPPNIWASQDRCGQPSCQWGALWCAVPFAHLPRDNQTIIF